MFFKFSILLLYIILVVNTVLGDTDDENEASTSYTEPDEIFEDKHVILVEDPLRDAEDEILRDSFNDCRKWLSRSLNSTISKSELWLYLGKNRSDYYRLDDYFINNPGVYQGPIDLNRYSELFKYICSKRGVTVKEWVANRKNKAASRTFHEVTLLPRGDHD
ncbi:uncharacterized protein LOC126847316 [Adelges cooleyi]|uniref:uncharacterized protein LOC126847316 n=1 Tax=Adelges cooleyi TaxID=133065 RepID=UPI00217FC7F4|nr:uncharacterized protein LOC126847316 [Adelges cooleyi]